MGSVTLVDINLGKHSFHMRGQDRKSLPVFRRKCNCMQLINFGKT